MSKKATWLNRIICVVLLISVLTTITGAISDFDDAKNGFELFKALFWIVAGSATFGLLMNRLVENKPIWKLWS
jgi:hypothetical protein